MKKGPHTVLKSFGHGQDFAQNTHSLLITHHLLFGIQFGISTVEPPLLATLKTNLHGHNSTTNIFTGKN